MPTIETMLEVLQKCPNCVLDLSEATEQEIQTEYSLLKKLGLLVEKFNPPKHNRKRGVHGTDHSD
jgi:hypothetical protein